jgi:hypothetical protein
MHTFEIKEGDVSAVATINHLLGVISERKRASWTVPCVPGVIHLSVIHMPGAIFEHRSINLLGVISERERGLAGQLDPL